jgi:TetR/AcrR family fatty acid metabolism transcriptional regulator
MNTESKISKTRREKVADREVAILRAASTTFNAKGYTKSSMAEIARAAGVADGTLYLYFKNKEDLVRAVLAQFYAELTEAAQIGVEEREDVKAKLIFLARHHMREIIANWRLLEIAPLIDRSSEQYRESELYKLNRAYVTVFDRVAKDAIRERLVAPETQLWILRDVFFGGMEYSARTMMFVHSDDDINAYVDKLMTLILTHENNGPEINIIERLETIANQLEAKI